MADLFIDHDNTTLYPSAYMSVPTGPASLPQEGDGLASGMGATPAVALASWDLTGKSATSATMTIMGATVSGITGAAGSAAATAAATAINASTASVATVTTGNISATYLRALVWARAVGAILTVYTRIASVNLNYSANTACAMAAGTGWSAAPATVQFSGGVSGPWRYFINNVALTAAVSGSQSGAVTGYGGFKSTVMTVPTATDITWIRTKRSGSDITCRTQTTSYCDCVTGGNLARVGTMVADAGVKWPGDDGVFHLVLASTHGSVSLTFGVHSAKFDGNNHRFHVLFQDIPYNFLGAGVQAVSAYGWATYEGVTYEISNMCNLTTGVKFNCDVVGNVGVIYRRCKFIVSRLNAYNAPQFMSSVTASGWGNTVMEDCEHVFTGLLSAPTGKLFSYAKTPYGVSVLVRNARIYDQNDLSTKFPILDVPQANPNPNLAFTCLFENIGGASSAPSDLASNFTGSIAPTFSTPNASYNYTLIDSRDQGAYRLENCYGYTDWIPGEGYPTLSALLPDGTPWSLRNLWYGKYIGNTQSYTVRLAQFSTEAAGIKTVTTELLFSGDIADADILRTSIVMSVSYTASTGEFRSETTVVETASPITLATGSAAWSGLTGTYAAYKPRKLSLTTTQAVKQNTNIDVIISFVQPCPTSLSGKNVFIDPEFRIEA